MLLLLILGYLPPMPVIVREHFAVIENNTVYAETCETDTWPLEYKPIFTQVLFRDFIWDTGTHEVQAWRMLKADDKEPFKMIAHEHQKHLKLLPTRPRSSMHATWNQSRGVWQVEWLDGDVHRVVTAKSYVETHTVGDPEIEERERFPMALRRELRKGIR